MKQVHLQRPCLICSVLDDHIRFIVLEIAKGQKDDVSLIYPDLCETMRGPMGAFISKWCTFFLIFPLMWANRFSPSKHMASRRPFPSIFNTCAYSA